MKDTSVVWLISLFGCQAGAQFLSGFGQTPYDPLCSEACLRSFSSLMLSCTVMDHNDGHSHMSPTTPGCYAHDTPFLTSVAWCMNTKCENVAVSKIEHYWEKKVTGSAQVPPKWSYSEALAEIRARPPTYQVDSADMELNVTAVVNPTIYLSQWNVLGNVRDTAILESTYGIIIFVSAVGIPIVLTGLGYMPFMGSIKDKVAVCRFFQRTPATNSDLQIKPYLAYPSLIGNYQVRTLPHLLGNAPTVGQSLYIFALVVLNVILSAVGYKAAQPNAWFASEWRETSAYVMYRTGAFAFMLAPLLLLFSSRNNLLLWITNWSHSTFMLLHRWVARIFMLHVLIHSVIGLQIYAHYSTTSWWIWGAVATVATVVVTLGSGLYVRKNNYELFLITHIVLSVFILVGSWYHLIQWYASMGMKIPDTSGYEVWLYIAFCVWFFDRLVRVGRIAKVGFRRSRVTEIGEGYVQIDIPNIHWGLQPGKHVYAYFPTLCRLRPWENHPFSVIPTPLLYKPSEAVEASLTDHDAEKDGQITTRTSATGGNHSTAGVTLLVKTSTGTTKYLKMHDNLLTLLDGPYFTNHSRDALHCDRILLIAGGIGITGLLPWAYSHWNVKLAWSLKESAKCLKDVINLDRVVEKDVRLGQRFDIRELISQEADAGWSRVAVVVCGPGGLCDDVRAAVVATAKISKTVFELEVDAFSW